MKCPIQLLRDDFLADLDFLVDPQRSQYYKEAERDPEVGGFRNPAFYLHYNYMSGQINVMIMSHSPLFRVMRQACASAPTVRANEDPFILLVMYLTSLLNAARRTAMMWRRRVSKDVRCDVSVRLTRSQGA